MSTKLTIVALALLFSGVSMAGEKSLYQDLDANKDGLITQTEASASPKLNEKWKEIDANADGMIDKAEFAKFEMISE